MMYCLTCGYKIEGTPKFCPECGSRLEGNVSEEDPRGNQIAPAAGGVSTNTDAAEPTPAFPTFPGMPMMGLGPAALRMMNEASPEGKLALEKLLNRQTSVWCFEYSTSGMMFRSGVTYRAWKDDDKVYAQVRLSGVDIKDAPVFEVDEAFAEGLEMSLSNTNADAWDGFNGHAQGVMDGDSFNFSFRDGNGRNISAHGYMAWPEGFGAARVVWDALFYGEYDKHFPNYAKRLQDYIGKTVFPQYGKCENSVYEVHYVAEDQDSFSYTENNMPSGIITYKTGRFTQARANDDTDKTWIEAALVRSVKTPSEVDPSINETGLILEIYRSDAEGVRKVLEERVYREVVIANEGEATILFREVDGKTVIGICRKITYHYGKTYKAFYFTAVDCIGCTWNELGEAKAQIPGREKYFPDEELVKFTEVMEMVGLTETAAKFRESKEDYKITEPYTKLLTISWFTNLNSEFPQKVRETEAKKEVDGYWVKIYTTATDYYFG